MPDDLAVEFQYAPMDNATSAAVEMYANHWEAKDIS
jgi:hypothetical protein